jgi:hypothetical protein
MPPCSNGGATRYLSTEPLPVTESHSDQLAKTNGFSLHAGVCAGANDRARLERLCRYIAFPAVLNERSGLTDCEHVRYTLKTPYRVGCCYIFPGRYGIDVDA